MNEAEVSLLAEAFINPSVALTADLLPEDFSDDVHARLWSMVVEHATQAKQFTLASLGDAPDPIKKYVQSIFDLGGGTGDARVSIAAIKDQSARRRIASVANVLAARAADPDESPEEVSAFAISELTKRVGFEAITASALAERITSDLQKPTKCYPTQLPSLDISLAGGLFAGKLYGVAARKKVGKTALLGTISHNLNKQGVKHLFIAMEMSAEEIEQRNIARAFKFNSVVFLHRNWPELPRLVSDYAVSVPDCVYYEHKPGATLDEVKRMIARARIHHDIQGFILDYWQLVGGKEKNGTEEYHLRNVAQWMADMCRRENLFGLVAAQINQEGNTRGGEGLKLACDCYLTLHREKESDRAWMEMEESRYTLYQHVGSETDRVLLFDNHGPHFRDITDNADRPQMRDGSYDGFAP